MICFIIAPEEAGRKLIRYLEIRFPKAPRSFLYQALRKNKIKVNGKRPTDLSVPLSVGDELKVFLTKEQESAFRSVDATPSLPVLTGEFPLDILYEDPFFLILNKPGGVLTQKSKDTDISLTEMALAYLGSSEGAYRPSFCHRLDRNTSGVIVMAKTLEAHHLFDQWVKGRSVHKYYYALVEGEARVFEAGTLLENAYRKDTKENIAHVRDLGSLCDATKVAREEKDSLRAVTDHEKGWKKATMYVKTLEIRRGRSLVEVELMSGYSHQIRAQLAFAGYPIVDDGKYNPHAKKYSPLLVAKALGFPVTGERAGQGLSGKWIEAPLPPAFREF